MIETTEFSFTLMRLMSKSAPQYSAKTFSSLRAVGGSLADGSHDRVVFAYHIPYLRHWAVAMLTREADQCTVRLRFADSALFSIPATLVDAVKRWLEQHKLLLDPTFDRFPCGVQDDGFSCGIAAMNAIEHVLFPSVPLWTPKTRDIHRIVKVLELMHAQIDPTCPSLMERYLQQRTLEREPAAAPSAVHGDARHVQHAAAADLIRTASTSLPLSAAVPAATEAAPRPLVMAIPASSSQSTGPMRPLLPPFVHRPIVETQQGRLPFVRLTEAQKAEKRKREQEEREARKEELELEREAKRHRLAVAAQEKLDKQRAQGRERTRRCRFNAEVAKGLRSPGRTKKTKEELAAERSTATDTSDDEAAVEEQPGDGGTNDSLSIPSIAQLSRPKRLDLPEARDPSHGGRPLKNEKKVVTRTNWQSPILWIMICRAAASAGWAMSPTEIVRQAQRLDDKIFEKLTPQVLGRWIERPLSGRPRWSKACEARVAKLYRPGGKSTRVGILAPYPELIESIKRTFQGIRNSGAPLDIHTARGLMHGMILHAAPGVFDIVAKDGSRFQLTIEFVRAFLRNQLDFAPRRPTRAAQKVPENAEELCTKTMLRLSYNGEEHFIPCELFINSDETNSPYAHGTTSTWNERGASQVGVVGHEEKRAFTITVGVSMSGALLPFQAIFKGKTQASLPKPTARSYDRAKALGFQFVASCTDSYWCTVETLKLYVTDILLPHIDRVCAELGLPPDQKAGWLIDLYAVHKSEEFLHWMKTTHPRIIVLFVPGGCTGILQPCDVGMNRVMKQALRRAAHADVVDETMAQLDDGRQPESVKLDTTLGVLRDRCVHWMVRAFEACNNEALVKKGD